MGVIIYQDVLFVMLSEERIKLMTRMASYEETEGRKNASVSKFFRGDYVGLQVLKAVIYASIAYMIVFGAYIYYDFENFMMNIYKMDLWQFAESVLKYYAITVVSYCVIIYVVFTVKYTKTRQNQKKYFNNLKLLGSMLVKESKKNR